MRSYVLQAGLVLIILIVLCGQLPASDPPYPHENDLLEIIFSPDSEIRLRDGALIDLAGKGLSGVDDLLNDVAWTEWNRICDLTEERLDEIHLQAELRSGKQIYDPNNIYRLRVPRGTDVWALGRELENLPGIMLARPVPKPTPSLPEGTSLA